MASPTFLIVGRVLAKYLGSLALHVTSSKLAQASLHEKIVPGEQEERLHSLLNLSSELTYYHPDTLDSECVTRLGWQRACKGFVAIYKGPPPT